MNFSQRFPTVSASIQQSPWPPVIAFMGGFAWDALTLSRVDNTFDLIILTGYLIGAAVFMLYGFSDAFNPQNKFLIQLKKHHQTITHFLLGGLFSAYVVFLFQSVSFSRSLIFFAIIAAVFVFHEFVKLEKSKIYFQLGILFVTGFLYLIFVLPIILKQVGVAIFIVSAIVSGIFTLGLMYSLRRSSKEIRENLDIKKASAGLIGVFAMISVSYSMNWMPPVPLALKDAMIATYITRVDGNYTIAVKDPKWYQIWRRYSKTYSLKEDGAIFCYASVYVPRGIETQIAHKWLFYDETKKEWIRTDQIPYGISGGRSDGYRGYTLKEKLKVGKWKVQVLDSREAILGVIPFEIVE